MSYFSGLEIQKDRFNQFRDVRLPTMECNPFLETISENDSTQVRVRMESVLFERPSLVTVHRRCVSLSM